MNSNEMEYIFNKCSKNRKMRPYVVEKDYWVCFALNYLFNKCKYKNAFVFKGGTSLSKVYGAIERFSEDVDLILDWKEVIGDVEEPWKERTSTQQDKYNKKMNNNAALFYKEKLVPMFNDDFEKLLGIDNLFEIDKKDEMIINFYYPRIFNVGYLRPCVRLEIGPLAEWMPCHKAAITSFIEEDYPERFAEEKTVVRVCDIERNFWEKLTILHKIHNFPEDKILPDRYARHLYDVYCMGNSWVKDKAFERKELLEEDVKFKQKFYYSKSAHYENATLKNISLIPNDIIMKALESDYNDMRDMIYGEVPSFEVIIDYLKELEKEVHLLE